MPFRTSLSKFAGLSLLTAATALNAQAPATAATAAENDALLAKAATLYYSAAKATPAHGALESFQCAVQPEWPALLSAIDKATGQAPAPPNDPRLALLTPITVSVHAEINGRSTLDWNQPANTAQPLDADSTEMLDRAHQTVEHALAGFFQFWTPFINGTIIPQSSKGIDVVKTASGVSLRAELRDQKLNEVFSPDMTLKEFNVSMSGVLIRFEPAFDSTPEGLLVKSFDAHIQLPGTPPPPEHRMNVMLDYQTVQGYELPAHLSLDITGTGRAAFDFSGCTVQSAAQ
jgi:hypothetical protein